MKNRTSRDYNHYRNHNRHARDADRLRRIHKPDVEKYPVYDDRGLDRSRIRVRRSRSPCRSEIRDRFDRDERFYDDHRGFDIDVARKYTREDYERVDRAGDDYMNVRRASLEYDSYVLDDNGRNGGVLGSRMERDEVGGRYVLETGDLGSEDEKLGYFHRQNQLLLEKRNGELRDGRDHDELGIEKPVERGSSRYVEKGLFSSRDSKFFSSLARSEEFVSYSSGISRKKLPGRLNERESESEYLASESVHFDEYSEKRQYVSPRRYGDQIHDTRQYVSPRRHGDQINDTRQYVSPRRHRDQINDTRQYVSPRRHGDQINDTRSRSRSYLGLPEETRVDHFYAGKGKIDRDVEEYREQHTSRMSDLDSTVEPSRGKRRSDDGLWEPYSSSRGRLTPCDGYGSKKHQDFHADMDGGRVFHHDRYDVLRTREYEPPIARLYDSPRKRGEPSESERRLVDEQFRDEAVAHHVSILKQYDAPNSSRQNYPQVGGVNKVSLVSFPRKKKSSKYDYEKERRIQRDQSHSSYPVKSGSGNIKRRMGPVPKKRNHL